MRLLIRPGKQKRAGLKRIVIFLILAAALAGFIYFLQEQGGERPVKRIEVPVTVGQGAN